MKASLPLCVHRYTLEKLGAFAADGSSNAVARYSSDLLDRLPKVGLALLLLSHLPPELLTGFTVPEARSPFCLSLPLLNLPFLSVVALLNPKP
jgi:hypothetical protein